MNIWSSGFDGMRMKEKNMDDKMDGKNGLWTCLGPICVSGAFKVLLTRVKLRTGN